MKKQLFILISFVFFGASVFAQGITNKGAVITVSSGTYVVVDNGGGYFNESDGTLHGQIDLNGTLQIEGNFENNVTDVSNHVFINTDGTGTILFTGSADQHILNSVPNAYIDFENLTVNKSSNTVFVDDGSAATVEGNLAVNSGTFRLASHSDGEDPSGSLITNGTVSGSGALYVDRHFETNGRYQYIGIPVDNATDDLFDNTGSGHPFNANLYTYDESYNATTDPTSTAYSNWTDPTYEFYNAWTQIAVDGSAVGLAHNGTGYITYNERELDVNFGGSPSNLNNSGSYGPAISYTPNDNTGGAGDYYDGWNIIGNPYPCALDVQALTLTNVNQTIYYWDGDIGNYKYYNFGGTQTDDGSNVVLGGTRYIPAMQSFSIKTNAISPSITIDASARIHNIQAMYKSSKDAPEYGQTQFVKLKTVDGDFSDEMVVRFIDGSLEGFDNDYDAYKMFPSNPPVMIYSLITNPETPIAINSLPIEDIGTSIPLGFISAEPGTYTITAEDVVFDAGTDVKLIDTYENTETLLNEGTEYTFSFDGGEKRDRFYLFSAPSGSDVTNPEDGNLEFSSNVWSSQNKLYVAIKSNKLIDANVKVYDVLGRTVIDQNVNGTYNIINVPGASGTYFVKLTGANGISQTKKVFIKK